jgi:hypothetical protein
MEIRKEVKTIEVDFKCPKCSGFLRPDNTVLTVFPPRLGEMVDFNKQYDHHQKAMLWWNNLNVSEKRNYEYQIFGDGEYWEDNTICETDIVIIYDRLVYKTSYN